MSRKAFTLIELLIVVAISALLSTLAITFSSVGRNQVALSVEAAKIAQFILQAKQLSIATFIGPSTSCGYGLTFDVATQTYSIFTYAPQGVAVCRLLPASTITGRGIAANEKLRYTVGTWQVHLAKGVILKSQADSLGTVLFYPPAPSVFLSKNGTTFDNPAGTLTVHLTTVDGKNSASVSVNPQGQVNNL